MYEFIRGRLHDSPAGIAVIEAGGIGYRVLVPRSTGAQLGAPGGEVTLLLHHPINAEQGEQRLFGFATGRERLLFLALLEVKGIGPATALEVMSAADLDELVNLIVAGNTTGLKKFKGIGPKTAERLVTELRDKLAPLATAPGGKVAAAKLPPGVAGSDAVQALVALGYPAAKSEAAVARAAEALGASAGTEALVRRALQMV